MMRFFETYPPPPRTWGRSAPDPRLGRPAKSSGPSKRSHCSHRLRLSFRAAAGALFGLALFALAGAGGATTAKAASISTVLETNSDGGGGLYFNLTVGPRDIAITGLKTHVGIPAGNTRSFSGFQVYMRDGTAFGKETDLSGWRKASDGTLTVPGDGDGRNQLSPVALKSKIVLKAGKTYGFSLVAPSGVTHRFLHPDFRTGTRPLRYANADLELNLGSWKRRPFVATGLDVVVNTLWNGEIQYAVSAVPLPAAAWLFLSALGALGAHRAWAGRRRTV